MEKIKEIIKENITIKEDLLNNSELLNSIQQVAQIIAETLQNGNKIMFCGNGGSAADAQHLAAEFSGKFLKNRRALPALCLNTNVSTLTAIANDFGYENVFLRQVQGVGQCGDILIGISTSGQSQNVIEAFKYASSVDIKTISLTGKEAKILGEYSDINIAVPSKSTPRIQETHILIGHIICELVENILF